MKTAIILLCYTVAICSAQQRKVENQPPASAEKKRLESVTWNLQKHKLIWIVQRGTLNNGQFKATATDTYEISPDEATMTFAEESRGFTQEEATSLHKLLDTLSLYCAESVIWWEQGQGTKLDGSKPEGQEEIRKDDHRPTPIRKVPAPTREQWIARMERTVLATLR